MFATLLSSFYTGCPKEKHIFLCFLTETQKLYNYSIFIIFIQYWSIFIVAFLWTNFDIVNTPFKHGNHFEFLSLWFENALHEYVVCICKFELLAGPIKGSHKVQVWCLRLLHSPIKSGVQKMFTKKDHCCSTCMISRSNLLERNFVEINMSLHITIHRCESGLSQRMAPRDVIWNQRVFSAQVLKYFEILCVRI